MSTTETPARSATPCASLAAARVAVVMGGTSGEREVSLTSGRSILESLQRSTGRGRLAAARPIEIDARGRWVVGNNPVTAGEALAAAGDVDVFFLALHGGAGEDGTIQGLLTAAGRRFTGSGVGASAICMDKAATRALAQTIGIEVARGRVVEASAYGRDAARELELVRALGAAPHGWFVKPRRGGSSVNTHAVRVADELGARIAEVLAGGDDALVEVRVKGIEVSCGVLETSRGEPRDLPPIEIQPTGGEYFDYQQKYSESGAREVCPAPSLSAAAEAEVRRRALAIHRLCGCAGYSRTDFIVPDGGASTAPVMLEVNTLPGMTPRSLLPQEAAVVGIDYDELCLLLVGAAR